MTNIALLIFANTAQREAASKVMKSNLGKNTQIRFAQAMLDYTRQIATASGLPVIEISSEQQSGSNFAERYTQALNQVFAQGYDQIISIGTDCPSLSVQDLQEAANKLQHSNGVIGLAKDGGAYLIGLRKGNFNPQTFIQLPWRSASLASAILSYFEHQEATCLILSQQKSDVDNPQQLALALQEIDTSHYIAQVLFFLTYQPIRYGIYRLNLKLFSLLIFSIARRGPPQISLT